MHFIYLSNLPLLTYFKFSKHIRVFWRFFQKVKKSRNSQFLYKSGWAGLREQDSNLRPSGYERRLTAFCKFVKIRVFVGISVFTRVLICRTFVHF